MNRHIIGRISAVSALAALLALGCVVEQTGDTADDQTAFIEGSPMVGTSDDEQVSGRDPSMLKQDRAKKPSESMCTGCGPLPDPWKMGPLPDPWSSSSSGGSTGSGSGSSGSTGSGSNKK